MLRTKNRTVVGLANLAIRIGVKLVGQFNDGPGAERGRTEQLFGRFKKVVRALPPSQHLSEQLQDNLDSWPRMWEGGEFIAARYQMVQLIRKLRNYRDDWDGTGAPVVLDSPLPQLPAFASADASA